MKEEKMTTPCLVTVEFDISGEIYNLDQMRKLEIMFEGSPRVVGHSLVQFEVPATKTRHEIREMLKGTLYKIKSIEANYDFPEDRKSDKEQVDIYLNESKHFKALKLELEELNRIPLDCVRFRKFPLNCDYFELKYDIRPDGNRQILRIEINHVGDGKVQRYHGKDAPHIASKCKHFYTVLTSEYVISPGILGIAKNVVEQASKTLYSSFMRYRMFAISSLKEDTHIKVITIRDLVLGNYTEDTFKTPIVWK